MIKALGFYKLAIPSEKAFLKEYANNPNLQNLAKKLWHDLNAIAPGMIILMLLVALATCWYYYRPYNNQPGRHYKPSHWWGFMLITFILSVGLTFLLEALMVKSSLDGATWIEFKIALCNGFYSCIAYFVGSWMWCTWGKTRAYRYLKFF